MKPKLSEDEKDQMRFYLIVIGIVVALVTLMTLVQTASAADLTPVGVQSAAIEGGTPSYDEAQADVFAAWENSNASIDILREQMRVPCEEQTCVSEDGALWRYPIGQPARRGRRIASTVVQWLGTDDGKQFLSEALPDWCGTK